MLDAIEQVAPELDPTRVGAIGCSRYGKAALAAGIFDERVCLFLLCLPYGPIIQSACQITLTLPMSSGAEGIAPWRFQFEECEYLLRILSA